MWGESREGEGGMSIDVTVVVVNAFPLTLAISEQAFHAHTHTTGLSSVGHIHAV